MDFVTARLQMEIGMLFLSLTLKMWGNWENWRDSFWWSSRLEPRQNLGKMTKKGSQKFRNFPEKIYKKICGPRTETKFVKWSASRKRLRTVALK